MPDPSSAAAGVVAADKMGRGLHDVVIGDSKSVKKFGLGKPQSERDCEKFLAYICVEGLLTEESVVRVLRSGDALTLRDVRVAHEKHRISEGLDTSGIRQQRIMDQDGYMLTPDMLVHDFSQQCRISLRLCDSSTRMMGMTRGIGSAAAEMVSKVKTRWSA